MEQQVCRCGQPFHSDAWKFCPKCGAKIPQGKAEVFLVRDGLEYVTPKRRAVKTSEFRPPRRGEYYLSGAIPEVYRAPNDLTQAYRIMRLITEEG